MGPDALTPKRAMPKQVVPLDHKTKLLTAFSGKTGEGIFMPRSRAARKIPMVGEGNVRLIVSKDDSQPVPQKERALRPLK